MFKPIEDRVSVRGDRSSRVDKGGFDPENFSLSDPFASAGSDQPRQASDAAISFGDPVGGVACTRRRTLFAFGVIEFGPRAALPSDDLSLPQIVCAQRRVRSVTPLDMQGEQKPEQPVRQTPPIEHGPEQTDHRAKHVRHHDQAERDRNEPSPLLRNDLVQEVIGGGRNLGGKQEIDCRENRDWQKRAEPEGIRKNALEGRQNLSEDAGHLLPHGLARAFAQSVRWRQQLLELAGISCQHSRRLGLLVHTQNCVGFLRPLGELSRNGYTADLHPAAELAEDPLWFVPGGDNSPSQFCDFLVVIKATGLLNEVESRRRYDPAAAGIAEYEPATFLLTQPLNHGFNCHVIIDQRQIDGRY